MPVRNEGTRLDEAVRSIFAQSFAGWELIAVDDHSEDDSLGRLTAWANRDPRVRVLRASERGLVPALNTGLAAARAPMLARMDADDVAHPERLQAQHDQLAAAPDVGVSATWASGWTDDGSPLGGGMQRYLAWSNGLTTPEGIARERFIESPLIHPTVMLRTELLRAHGGYRADAGPEDYDLWLRLLAAGVRIAKLPRALLAWRDHGARATRTDPAYAPERHRALKIAHLLRGPLRAPRPLVFWGVGLEGKPLLRALREAERPACAAIDIDPRKIGQTIHGALVHSESAFELVWRAAGPDALLLVAVGVPRAREEIRARLTTVGLTEGENAFFLR